MTTPQPPAARLHIVTSRPWKAERLGARLHSPQTVIDTSSFVDGVDSVWLPGSHASLQWRHGGDGWLFQDALWWRLPSALLGREVVHGSAADVAHRLRQGAGFVKLARHKYDYFPAKLRTATEFGHDLQARPQLPLHEFLWSEPVDIAQEYRVWVAEHQVLYGCTYTPGPPLSGEPEAPAPAVVLQFAGRVAQHIGGAVVIDVARLAGGDLVVVETNPVWCAGFLSAPRDVLAAALLASQGREHVDDPFIPDAGVQLMLNQAEQRTSGRTPHIAERRSMTDLSQYPQAAAAIEAFRASLPAPNPNIIHKPARDLVERDIGQRIYLGQLPSVEHGELRRIRRDADAVTVTAIYEPHEGHEGGVREHVLQPDDLVTIFPMER